MLPLQERLDPGMEGELDGLARRAGGGNDNDPTAGVVGPVVGIWVGREEMVALEVHRGKVHPSRL